MTPAGKIIVFVVLLVAMLAIPIKKVLNQPVLGLDFIVSQDRLAVLENDKISVVRSISGNGVTLVNPDASVVIEEPDQLADYPAYHNLFAWQATLNEIFSNETVRIQYDSGETVDYVVANRELTQLPLSFYIQLLVGFCCVLIAASVWVFNTGLAASLLLSMGVGVALASYSSAIYSSRELTLLVSDFFWASKINAVGTLLYAASLVTLIANYPARLSASKLLFAAPFIAAGVSLIGDYFSIGLIQVNRHLPALVALLISAILVRKQWTKSSHQPENRAIVKWLTLSLIGSSGIFAGFILVPPLIGEQAVASQGIMFIGFGVGFVLIALGVHKYRLFELDVWWYRFWLWLIVTMLIASIDIAIAAAFRLAPASALGIALAIVIWLYFPLRKLLSSTLLSSQASDRDAIYSQLIHLAASAKDQAEMELGWQKLLDELFRPLTIEPFAYATQHGGHNEISLADNGRALVLPTVTSKEFIRLSFKDNGRKLFNQKDVNLVTQLQALYDHAVDSVATREEGAKIERERIKKDLHDDLGAHLLCIANSENAESSRGLARDALGDLRLILAELDRSAATIQDTLDALEYESRSRLQQSNIELTWAVSIDDDVLLSVEYINHLIRIVRELVSNTIKHSGASEVAILWNATVDSLRLVYRDDGKGIDSQVSASGFGINNLSHRAEQLDGVFENCHREVGVQFKFSLPLKSDQKIK